MDRRSFIKLTAISGAGAAVTTCGGGAEHEIIRFVPDEVLIPGVAEWRPGVCPACASGCGLLVRVMSAEAEVVRDGQAGIVEIRAAKKLEGNPDHPVNHGALCARGQAVIQATYHPDRITQPLKRSGERGEGAYEAVSWDAALEEIVARLNDLEASGGQARLAALTKTHAGHRRLLLERFLESYGAPDPVVYDLFSDDVLRYANGLSFGRRQLPTFDLARARHVLNFGADFLGTWNSPVAHTVAYGEMRQGRAGIRGSFVHVEPRLSQTGANADEWVPARPGTEGAIALCLAHVLMAAQLRQADAAGRAGSLIEGWSDGLAAYTPARVEEISGVAAPRLERIARELVDRSPAVVMIGGAPLAHTNGLFNAVAVNALNALLGSLEQPGGVFFTPLLRLESTETRQLSGALDARPSIERLAASLLSDEAAGPQVLLIEGGNPVFTTPPAWRVRDALTRVPFIVSFSSFLDETTALADLILPDHSFLESWVDAMPESGASVAVASVAPPAMRPLHDTRAMPDILLDVGRRLRRPLDLPWESFEALLRETYEAYPPLAEGSDTWSDVQKRGGWWGPPSASAVPTTMPGAPVADTAPRFDGGPLEYPFFLLPYASGAFLDGSLAHLPWLQEMPDPLTTGMWSSWIEMNPATAERLGAREGDIVDVASAHGRISAPVAIVPGLAPDVVAMPVGQGHRSFTRYATGRGENPVELLSPLTEPVTGALAWAATRVQVSRTGQSDGRLILFAGSMHEHPPAHRQTQTTSE